MVLCARASAPFGAAARATAPSLLLVLFFPLRAAPGSRWPPSALPREETRRTRRGTAAGKRPVPAPSRLTEKHCFYSVFCSRDPFLLSSALAPGRPDAPGTARIRIARCCWTWTPKNPDLNSPPELLQNRYPKLTKEVSKSQNPYPPVAEGEKSMLC